MFPSHWELYHQVQKYFYLKKQNPNHFAPVHHHTGFEVTQNRCESTGLQLKWFNESIVLTV